MSGKDDPKLTWDHFDKVIHATSAGLAIVVVAELDLALSRALRTRFRPISNGVDARLFEGYGPLSSLAGKIDMAYALDILTEELYEELRKIRRIRNAFSHTSNLLGFADPAVKNLFDRLRRRSLESEETSTDVQVFLASVAYIIDFLNVYAERAGQVEEMDIEDK